MHHVGRVDWSFTQSPLPPSERWDGLSRRVVVGPDEGAVHTELAVGALASGGWLGRHVHSFEEALYVLDGELVLEIGGVVHRLVPGDFAFMPLGVRHTLANDGAREVRWLSVNTPQRLPPDAPRRDTFFDGVAVDAAELGARAERPPFGDPTLRWVGWATTRGRRPRRRHSRSWSRPVAGGRPAWTRRSSPTAASP
jgi:quercetin dioxygenase-like cupin family protein